MSTTIAAIATPPGQGGIAIVRLSGPLAGKVLRAVFVPARPVKAWRSHRLMYGQACQNGEVIDECMAVLMRAPNSYTREDVAEIHCHGSTYTAQRVLEACLAAGAVPAQPGEFTRRAFLAGRIDLAQAEAVMDVIAAQSQVAGRQAVRQLQGGLSRQVESWLDQLVALRAGVEAVLDFPEDEISLPESLPQDIDQLHRELQDALAQAQAARLAREGARVVLAGQPNAGKSTLLNALLGYDRAIVTDAAGTTRDTLAEPLVINGAQLWLVDTAGLHTGGQDAIEQLGMQRTWQELQQADAVVWVLDSTNPQVPEQLTQTAQVCQQRGVPLLVVLSKQDLPSQLDRQPLQAAGYRMLPVSAQTQQGMPQLRQALADIAMPRGEEGGLLTRARHVQAVQQAADALADAARSLADGMPPDACCVDLSEAHHALCQITGTDADASLIDAIFTQFCLGK